MYNIREKIKDYYYQLFLDDFCVMYRFNHISNLCALLGTLDIQKENTSGTKYVV